MYQPSEKDQKQINNYLPYHPPKEGQREWYEAIRDKGKELAEFLTSECPPSRELSLAITNLEQAIFWAKASISRNE